MHRKTDKDADGLISLWIEPLLWENNLTTYYNADLRQAMPS